MAKVKNPNPGSKEAAELGCDCPVHANYLGEKEPEAGWVIRTSCRVHGDKTSSPFASVTVEPVPSPPPRRWGRFFSRRPKIGQ